MRRSRWQWGALLLVLVLARLAAAQEIGSIAELETVVEIGRGGAWNAAATGDAVHLGDVLRTQRPGRVRVLLRDGSVLNLGVNTELVITEQLIEPERGVLRSLFTLTQGKLRALVGESYRSSGAVWQVETPVAIIGVRGTEFVVTHDPLTDMTEVIGISGVVEVRSMRDPRRPGVLVRGNQRSVVQRGQFPTVPTGIDVQQLPEVLRDVTEIPPGPGDSLTAAQPVLAGERVPAADQPAQVPGPPAVGLAASRRRMPAAAANPPYSSPAEAAKQPEPAIQSTGGVGVHF